MDTITYDSVVIGGGTGGYVAALRLAQLGLKTALVESDKVGGVCLHRGCIPTKVLLHTADVYSLIKRADEFGLALDPSSLTFGYSRMQAKVEKVVTQLYKGVEYLLKKKGVTVYKGYAVLDGSGQVAVLSQFRSSATVARLTAPNILLATGSRWCEIPDLPTDSRSPIIDADGALELPNLPKEIVIAGAGQTGVEWASFLASFGTKVHLLEAGPRLLPAEDAEISGQLDRLLSRRGVQIYLNTSLSADQVLQHEGGVTVSLTVKDKPRQIQAEKLLVAVGRIGNTEGFGLEKYPMAKVKNGFLQADQNSQVGPGLWAIGDLTGGFGFDGADGPRYLLAHASSAQGIFVAERLAGKHPDPLNYAAIPRCTYSQPQIASLGLTEAQARGRAKAAGQGEKTAIKIGKFPFKANGRALMLGETEGFVKLVSDAASGDLLGAHITGPTATELIAEPSLAKLFDGSAWELAQSVRPHPALAEVIMEAARDTDGWAIHL